MDAMELENNINDESQQEDRKPAAKPSNRFKATFSGFLRDEHKYSIYCVAWSNDVYKEGDKYYRCCASVGGPYATVYQVEVQNPDLPIKNPNRKSGRFSLKQGYYDPSKDFNNEKEEFYACAFGGRSFSIGSPATTEASPNAKRIRLDCDPDEHKPPGIPPITELDLEQEPNGPEFLCVGGKLFQIKIIDLVRQKLWMTLTGHGDEITVLKFSPTDHNMLLSTSNDRSIRIWNIRNGTCAAILAGHHGHKDIVMSASWHCTGEKIVSSGHDNEVRIWDIGEGTKIRQAMKDTYHVSLRVHKNQKVVESKEAFKPVICQFPIHATNKVHYNPIDCVEFLGDLVLSKGEDKIVLWEPDYRNPDGNPKVIVPPPYNVTALRTMMIHGEEIYQMFYRFSLRPNLRHVAVGTTDGDVWVYDVGDFKGTTDTKLSSSSGYVCYGCVGRSIANGISFLLASYIRFYFHFGISIAGTRVYSVKFLIRITAFSPDGRILLCGGDGGMILKYDCYD